MPLSSVNSAQPSDAPSTSIARVGGDTDTVRARIELFANKTTDNVKRNWERLEERLRHAEHFSFRSAVAVPVFGEARLAKWHAGLERVKDIYRLELTMEWRLIKMAFWTGFGMGYFFGGATTYAESKRRFELYTAGKVYFDRPHNHLRARRLNYALIRFNAKGCKVGLKLAAGVVSVISLIVVPTTFRAHFSLLNIPLATIVALGFNTTLRGWGIVGWHASVPATIMATGLPLLLILCNCVYHRCSPDAFYWRSKAEYERQLRTEWEYRYELNQYATLRGKSQFFRFMPWAPAQMERERALGTWRWTSGVEDGLIHLEESKHIQSAGDELGEEEQKIVEALERKRARPWWQRMWS